MNRQTIIEFIVNWAEFALFAWFMMLAMAAIGEQFGVKEMRHVGYGEALAMQLGVQTLRFWLRKRTTRG